MTRKTLLILLVLIQLAAVCGVQSCANQPNAASEHAQPGFGAL